MSFAPFYDRSVKKEIILNFLLDQMHLTELKRVDKINCGGVVMRLARLFFTISFSSFALFSNFSWSQELPSGSLIVVTACEIAHGHSIDEVVTVARAIDYPADGAPNAVFYRTPVSGSDFSENWALRVVYWDDFAHFASASFPPSGPRDHLNELLACDGNNRTFLKNYSVGSGNAYDSGANLVSGVAARFCTVSPDVSIQDVYSELYAANGRRSDSGSETQMQLSHALFGTPAGTEMGTRITIRLVGRDWPDLAKRLDASFPASVGTPSGGIFENCTDRNLFNSYVTHWGL